MKEGWNGFREGMIPQDQPANKYAGLEGLLNFHQFLI